MCIRNPFKTHVIPIYLNGERPHEHGVHCIKEEHGDVFLLFIASREPIGIGEPYHQIGDRYRSQVIIRQSLLDALNQPESTRQTQATFGYLFGRKSEDGCVIVEGVVFAEDKDPNLLRLDPRRTVEGILEERMRVRGVTLVGTFSYADYSEGSIIEQGLSKKIPNMPHMFVLARGSTSYNEVAVITAKQDGGEVHNGIGVVEHGLSISWGLVTSVNSINEPTVEIIFL